MERKTFSVSFFVRRARISKKGLAPILARITTDGISKEVYIQCSVDPNKWDQAKGVAKGRDKYSQQVNAYLDEYRSMILKVRSELLKKGKEGNAIEIKNQLLAGTDCRMLLSEFAKYVEQRQGEVGTKITQKTADKYHRLLRYMNEYVKEKFNKEDILLTSVDYAYINGLYLFLQTAHKCHHNGAINLLCCFKNFYIHDIR